MKRIILLIFLLMLVVAVPSATGWWLLNTTAGLKAIVSVLQDQVPVDVVGIKGVAGTLAGGVTIQRISTQDGDISIVAHDVRIGRVHLSDWQRFTIDTFVVDRLVVDTRKPDAGQMAARTVDSEFRFTIPVPPAEIKIVDATLSELAVDKTRIEDVRFAGVWGGSGVNASQMSFRTADIAVDLSGQVSTGADPYIDVLLHWEMAPGRAGWLAGRGLLDELKVTQRLVSDDVVVTSSGKLDLSAIPTLSGRLTHTMTEQTPVSTLFTGSGESWQVQATTQLNEHVVEMDMTVHADSEGAWRADVYEGRFGTGVRFKGNVQITPDLSGELMLSRVDSEVWVPALEGVLSGTVRFTDELATGELVFDRLVVAGASELHAGQIGFRTGLDLKDVHVLTTANRLSLGDVTINEPRLSLEGTTREHVAFSLSWPGTQLDGSAAVADNDIQLRIAEDGVLTVGDLQLRNSESILVDGSDDRWRVSGHCWLGTIELCVDDAVIEGHDSPGPVGTYRIPDLRVLNVWLPLPVMNPAGVQGTWQLPDSPGFQESWNLLVDGNIDELLLREASQMPALPSLRFDASISAERASLSFAGERQEIMVKGDVETLFASHQQRVDTTVGFRLDLAALPPIDPSEWTRVRWQERCGLGVTRPSPKRLRHHRSR